MIPRTALPEVLRRIAALSAETGVRVANVFHAGDGNLHPLVLFDDAVPGEAERAEEVSGAILDLCIEHGGSITGEHGVGVGQGEVHAADVLPRTTSTPCSWCAAPSTRTGSPTPARCFPTPRLCGEVPGRHRAPTRWPTAGVAELF